MQAQTQSLEQKLAALREVENIYRLSKKWQRLTPDERRPNWEKIADAILRKALGRPVDTAVHAHSMQLQEGKHYHEHDERSARVFRRTLRNGVLPPDARHSFESGRRTVSAAKRIRPRRGPADHRARTVIQHGATDLQYPSHHVQGSGFVPSDHEVASHVRLEHRQQTSQPSNVPTADGTRDSYH